MIRHIACLAMAMLAGIPLRAGELDTEFGGRTPPVPAVAPVTPRASRSEPALLPTSSRGVQPADAFASELDEETPSQAWRRGFGYGGYGRGFGYGGFGRGFGYGGYGRGFGYGGYGRGFGYGGYGRGFSLNIGFGGLGYGYGGLGYGYGGLGYGYGGLGYGYGGYGYGGLGYGGGYLLASNYLGYGYGGYPGCYY